MNQELHESLQDEAELKALLSPLPPGCDKKDVVIRELQAQLVQLKQVVESMTSRVVTVEGELKTAKEGVGPGMGPSLTGADSQGIRSSVVQTGQAGVPVDSKSPTVLPSLSRTLSPAADVSLLDIGRACIARTKILNNPLLKK